MPEYIKREDIKYELWPVGPLCEPLMVVRKKTVDSIPAADVAPVVHGRWIPCDPDSDVRFYCSECGTEISTSWDYDCDEMWNGCPHCLARMDGEG